MVDGDLARTGGEAGPDLDALVLAPIITRLCLVLLPEIQTCFLPLRPSAWGLESGVRQYRVGAIVRTPSSYVTRFFL